MDRLKKNCQVLRSGGLPPSVGASVDEENQQLIDLGAQRAPRKKHLDSKLCFFFPKLVDPQYVNGVRSQTIQSSPQSLDGPREKNYKKTQCSYPEIRASQNVVPQKPIVVHHVPLKHSTLGWSWGVYPPFFVTLHIVGYIPHSIPMAGHYTSTIP